MKRKTNKTEDCFDFESKHNSMKTIINSLETISAKCELFFRQFNICIDNQNQLDDYKKLLTGFKSELGLEYVRQPTDGNQRTISRRSEDQSDNESDFEPNVSDSDFEDSDDQPNDRKDRSSLQNGDQSFVDQLSTKIMDFYKKDKKSGKQTKHYSCPITDCDFKSLLRHNVVQHLAKHTNERDHRCYWPKCEKTFVNRNSLLSHIESFHLRKERYKCCVEDCGQSFVSKINFQSHLNIKHFNITDHNCHWTECHLNFRTCSCLWPQCEKQFQNKNLLETHLEDFHLKKKINFNSNEDFIEDSKTDVWLKCDQKGCDFQTVSEQDLNEHKTQHKSRYISIRRRKDIARATEESRVPQINRYTGKPLTRRRRPRNFRCSWPACEAVFESQHTVAIHMRKHTGEKPFQCDWPECGKSFRFKGGLKLHKESIHLKLKQFKCDQCDEAFLLQTALTVHKSKHTGVKRLQCDWPGCEWRTNFGQQLEIHRKRTHEGKKVYFKKYRKSKFDPNSMFDSNGKLKAFGCEWPGCERRFKYECNLNPHMKWHQKSESEPNTEKKKYFYPKKARSPKTPKEKKPKEPKKIVYKAWKCDWPNCQSSYTTKNMLTQHLNIHTGLKPYRCHECEQAFAYKSSLSSHIATNHPSADQIVDRPFKCNYFGCNRSFDKPRALMAHQRIAHKWKPTKNDTQLSAQPMDEYSSSTCYSSPPQELTIPEPYVFQKNVIRLDRIKAFNALQIQTQNQNFMSYPSTHRRERMCPTPTPQTTHTTAKKLLTNAKRPRAQPVYNNPVDSEAIAQELPHPCTYSGCWRRFKTVKALEWHLKKFHDVGN